MRSRGEGEIGAIIRRGARSTIAIDEGHDRRARSQLRLTKGAIDERTRPMSGAIAGEVSSSSLSLRSGLSLSLSLSFRK